MRCKVGDLCIIVNVQPKYEMYLGRISTIVSESVYKKYHVWVLDLKHTCGTPVIITDDGLRPIRDNPGQDETLTWAPHKETA